MKKKENKKPSRRALEKIRKNGAEVSEIWSDSIEDAGNTDVLGSYTGTPKDSDETPVQDADDL